MNDKNHEDRGKEPTEKKPTPAGRTVLLVAVIITFIAGIFGGYLLATEKPVAEKVLSDETYLIGIGDSPTAGPDAALITIVEFNDMRCTECNHVDNILRRTVDLYSGQVRVVWKNLPADPESEDSKLAAEIGVGASYGGRFWEIRDKISVAWGKLDLKKLESISEDLGLDGKRLVDELGRGVYSRRLNIDIDTAGRMNISRVPTVFVNGKILLGEVTLEKVRHAIELQLPEAKTFLARGIDPIRIYWEIVKRGKSTIE